MIAGMLPVPFHFVIDRFQFQALLNSLWLTLQKIILTNKPPIIVRSLKSKNAISRVPVLVFHRPCLFFVLDEKTVKHFLVSSDVNSGVAREDGHQMVDSSVVIHVTQDDGCAVEAWKLCKWRS